MLAAEYNLVLPKSSILQNYRILEQLRKRPENRQTELAVKAFLVFIFAGILLLKLFEPSSVRLYLSEVLQQEYDRYLAGTFDELLPLTEKSTWNRSAMSPQRFYAFLVSVWTPARRLEEQNAETRARMAAAKESLGLLERMRKDAEADAEKARAEVQRLWKVADDANQSFAELESAIAAVREDVESLSRELVAIDAPNTAGSSRAFDERARLEYRSYITRELAKSNQVLRDLEDTVPIETDRRNRAQAALLAAEARAREAESELVARETEERRVRTAVATSTGAQAVATSAFPALG